jgi:sarcosine oxidase
VATCDVIVLGLGGMGSAAVAQVAARGRRVIGIDQFAPLHDRGSSHGRTRVIRQAYFEDPAYVPLLLRAYELWRQLQRASGRTLLRLCGGLMIGAPESEVVAGSLRSARQHSLPHELLERRELRRRFPMFRLPPETIALYERQAGLTYCERAVEAHLAVAARAGAALRFEERVIGWAAQRDGHVTVKTDHATYEAGQLIVTPGPWAPELLGSIGAAMGIERQVLFWFQPPDGVAPFAPDRFPIFFWQSGPSAAGCPYGFPAVDGPTGGVKISLHRKPTIERCTPETVDRRIRDGDVAEIRDALRSFLPALDGALVNATTCLYTMTPDQHFVIGVHPDHPQVKMAAGFSGHGFKFCPVVGEMLADLTTTGQTRFEIGLFDPRRFQLGSHLDI